MTTSHTLSIAVDEPFTIHRRARSTAETPTFSKWLGAFLSSVVTRAHVPSGLRPVSGYYKDAAGRACASAPVTSLRQIAGNRH